MYENWKIRAFEHEPTKKNAWTISKKFAVAAILTASLLLFYIWTGRNVSEYDEKVIADFYETNAATKYLIRNSKCKIPAFNPWEYQSTDLYEKQTYIPCSLKPLLSTIKRNATHVVLSIERDVRIAYSRKKITCCFAYVERANDDHITVSNCTYFEDEAVMTKNIVVVRCYVENEQIYWNVHAFAFASHDDDEYVDRPPSVLLIAIDSVSRLNMQRVLTNTHDYLETNEWIGYVAYNKIDLNTFPNVMAILSGLDADAVSERCDPTAGLLDKCRMIWDDFKRFGFVTAYGEDCARVNTFNHFKKGFATPPTDVYYRPYGLVLREFAQSQLGEYCSGPEVQGERIFNLIKDFASTFKNRPSFGLFWMSSFSHDDSMMPGRMDDKTVELLKHLEREEILNNSVVVFLSDHGIRYSGTRLSRSGWYEERLPYIYFWLPRWFRRRYPNETKNLINNSKKLTTPFDVHMTLQHLMVLSGLNYTMKRSSSCPNAKSFFRDIDEVRSCEDACIPEKWCTCIDYQPYDAHGSLSKAAAKFALDYLHNTLLANRKEYVKCKRLFLGNVMHASVAKLDGNRTRKFLVMFVTRPYTILEATVDVEFRDNAPVFYASQLPTRVNAIMNTADCTSDVVLETLCYCKDVFN